MARPMNAIIRLLFQLNLGNFMKGQASTSFPIMTATPSHLQISTPICYVQYVTFHKTTYQVSVFFCFTEVKYLKWDLSQAIAHFKPTVLDLVRKTQYIKHFPPQVKLCFEHCAKSYLMEKVGHFLPKERRSKELTSRNVLYVRCMILFSQNYF